jgi:Ala-tRNA(Pro) deacylase
MLAAPLIVYFFVLLGVLILGEGNVLDAGEIAAVAILGLLCVVVIRAWAILLRDAEHEGDEPGYARPSVGAGMEMPEQVLRYLANHHVEFNWYAHRPAATAGELAGVLHIAGDGVAKPVLVRADDTIWMAVVPANERVDLGALRELLHARAIELVDEDELGGMFPDCELGAEPPFGRMFHIPTIVDTDLTANDRISFHGGRHDEAIEVDTGDYIRLERPLVGHFGDRAGAPA